MIAVLFLVFFATNTLSAPTQNFTPPWMNMKNDRSLKRFQSNLLNSTLLTFIDDCYSPELSSSKDIIPCSYYFDAVKQLNSTAFVVQQPTFEKLLNDYSKDICNKTHLFPALKYFKTNNSMKFTDPISCVYMCIQEMGAAGLVTKPICTFLAWMGDQINKLTQTPASVLPTNIASSANPNLNAVTKKATVVSHEPDEPEPPAGKPGITLIQSEANSQQVPVPERKELSPANNQSARVAQAPTKNEQSVANTNGAHLLNTAIDTPNQKHNLVVAATPPAAEAPLSVPTGEQIQTPAVQETPIGDINLSNVDTQPVKPAPKQLPYNPKKPESLPNEDQPIDNDSEADPNEDFNPDGNDDDPDEFEMSQQKLAKDPPLAIPDENDQKSSQEIIDRNYLPNTNHVKDPFLEESGSNFFTYFLIGMFLCIVLYVVYHNKSKILALLLEGRRSDKGRSGRRKHTAAYRKLDSNLEEAITSSASGRTTQIIY